MSKLNRLLESLEAREALAKKARQAVRKAENDRERRREARLTELLIAMMKRTEGLAAQAEALAKTLFVRPIDIEDFELNGQTTWFAKVLLANTEAEEAPLPLLPSRSEGVGSVTQGATQSGASSTLHVHTAPYVGGIAAPGPASMLPTPSGSSSSTKPPPANAIHSAPKAPTVADDPSQPVTVAASAPALSAKPQRMPVDAARSA